MSDMEKDRMDIDREGIFDDDAVNEAAQETAQKAAADAADAGEKAADNAEKKAKKVKKASTDGKKASGEKWVPGPNLPNQLTIARICMIPLFVVLLLWMKKPAGNILAMIIFIVASLTDAFDGHIARKYNYITTFGKFMDPLADKLLVNLALIGLMALGKVNIWLVMLIIARDFIISGFRLVAAEKGSVIAASIWGKVKTAAQMVMVCFLIMDISQIRIVGVVLQWLVCLLTLFSLIDYLVKNRGVLKEVD